MTYDREDIFDGVDLIFLPYQLVSVIDMKVSNYVSFVVRIRS